MSMDETAPIRIVKAVLDELVDICSSYRECRQCPMALCCAAESVPSTWDTKMMVKGIQKHRKACHE
jgi:hypothetical protein